MIEDPVAMRELVCVRPDGVSFPVTMTIGRPRTEDNSARCAVSMEPLYSNPRSIGGTDSWQAVQLAMRFCEELLRHEVEQGNRIYWMSDDGGIDSEYAFDEPSNQ